MRNRRRNFAGNSSHCDRKEGCVTPQSLFLSHEKCSLESWKYSRANKLSSAADISIFTSRIIFLSSVSFKISQTRSFYMLRNLLTIFYSMQADFNANNRRKTRDLFTTRCLYNLCIPVETIIGKKVARRSAISRLYLCLSITPNRGSSDCNTEYFTEKFVEIPFDFFFFFFAN